LEIFSIEDKNFGEQKSEISKKTKKMKMLSCLIINFNKFRYFIRR